MSENYDVAIIGAGPAGTSCALELRNSGLKVALIDKKKFPRNKTCGDAIPGPTLKFLKKIGQEFYDEFYSLEQKQKIASSILYLKNGASLEINWKTDAYNSQRYHFDDFLLNQVKKYTLTTIYEGVAIKDIKRSGQIIHLKTKRTDLVIQCTMVIGCDGANSMVAKALHQRQIKLPKAVALSARFEGVAAPIHANEFYLLKNIPGYFWIFPIGLKQFNVGYGLFEQHHSKSIHSQKIL